MVALRLSAACNALENQAQLARWAAQASMEEQWGYYEQNLAKGLGSEASASSRTTSALPAWAGWR